MTEVTFLMKHSRRTIKVSEAFKLEKFTVDRIEGNFAVLEKETGGTVDVALSLIGNVKEGDVVFFDGKKYTIDEKETNERKKRIQEKMKMLFGKDN